MTATSRRRVVDEANSLLEQQLARRRPTRPARPWPTRRPKRPRPGPGACGQRRGRRSVVARRPAPGKLISVSDSERASRWPIGWVPHQNAGETAINYGISAPDAVDFLLGSSRYGVVAGCDIEIPVGAPQRPLSTEAAKGTSSSSRESCTSPLTKWFSSSRGPRPGIASISLVYDGINRGLPGAPGACLLEPGLPDVGEHGRPAVDAGPRRGHEHQPGLHHRQACHATRLVPGFGIERHTLLANRYSGAPSSRSGQYR